MIYEFVVTYRNLKNGEVFTESVTVSMAGSASFAKYEAEQMFKSTMTRKGFKQGVDYAIISTN